MPADNVEPSGMPRWFKLFALVAGVIVAGVVVLHLTGHMPHMHDMS